MRQLVQLPRRVAPDEIIRIRTLPHAIGWRYWPGAKNQPMRLCDCPMCLPRREVKARRYRGRCWRAWPGSTSCGRTTEPREW